MATWLRGNLDEGEEPINDWMQRRTDKVARLIDPKTDASQRRNWNASTRTGANLVARTPSELRALPTEFVSSSGGPVRPDSVSFSGKVVPRLRAGARGATDAVLVGHGDEAEAALNTIPAIFSGDALGPQYRASLQRARAQDQYDRTYYPLSRDVGEVLGTGAALFATDGLAAAAAPRFAAGAYSAARAIPAMTGIGRARLAASGAGAGVTGQFFSDLLARHPSDWRDYASSALGGTVVATGAPRIGAIYAGGFGAGARYLTDSVLNLAPPQTDQLARDMTTGGYLGAAGQVVGEQESNALDWKSKGKLGEHLSEAKLAMDGEKVLGRQKIVKLGQRRSTRPDQLLEPDPVTGVPRFNDAKFGPTARPTDSQRLAEEVYPGSYQYHYWMPSHVGQILGSTLATLGIPMLDRSDNQIAPYR